MMERGSLRGRPFAILPGQYFDTETGLHQNWHRDYDPGIGRYLQSDPIGLRGGLSTYGYAYQNPGKFIDPMGLAGTTTHGLRRCSPGDSCETLMDKMNKLVDSLKERRQEMEGFSTTGQRWMDYTGHAIQIWQQNRMLEECQRLYSAHQPPCCDSAPQYDAFPLPAWRPPVYIDDETQQDLAAAAAMALAVPILLAAP
jgi:RHS repeat-associated protein